MQNHSIEAWNELKRRLKPGDLIKGQVIDVKRFGVFLDIGEIFHGLVLIPHMYERNGVEVEDYPKKGMLIEGTILDFSDSVDLEWAYVSIGAITILS